MSRAGHRVTVFERSPGELKGRGAGIGTPESMLQALIDRDLLDEDFPYFTLSEMPFTGRASANDRLGQTAWVMPISLAVLNWADLFHNLRKRVPDICYHQDVTVTGARTVTQDKAELDLADGSTHTFDLIIFADGYRSLGRHLLFPEAELQYRGYVLWRGVLAEQELTDSEPLGTSIPRISYKGLSGHLVLYFVPGLTGSVASGERLVNWAAYIPVSAEDLPDFLIDREGRQRSGSLPPGAMGQGEEARLKQLMQEHLPTYYAEIITASHDTFAQPIYTVELPAYHQGRICLMGDAGVVAQPFTGSGVFKGVNNAVDLAESLQANADLDTALAKWGQTQTATGQRLAVLGQQMEQAWIWAAADFSEMDSETTAAWWKKAVTFPEEFTYQTKED
jgi:2-polyprenyl-6-methoxyphenol hydroxylase-like FAD-dependent oxidoreductase